MRDGVGFGRGEVVEDSCGGVKGKNRSCGGRGRGIFVRTLSL